MQSQMQECRPIVLFNVIEKKRREFHGTKQRTTSAKKFPAAGGDRCELERKTTTNAESFYHPMRASRKNDSIGRSSFFFARCKLVGSQVVRNAGSMSCILRDLLPGPLGPKDAINPEGSEGSEGSPVLHK